MRGTLTAVAAGVVLLLAVLVVAALVYDSSRHDRIADGVRVGAVELGGLSEEEAHLILQHELAAGYAHPVTVRHRARTFKLRPEESAVRFDAQSTAGNALRRSRRGNPLARTLRDLTGGRLDADVEPVVQYSPPAVTAFVGRVAERIDRPARDADIDMVGYRLRRTPARNGLTVRRRALERAIVAQLLSPGAEPAIKAPVKITERPDRTMAELRDRYPQIITISRRRKVLRLYRRLRLAESYRVAIGGVGNRTPAGRYEIESKVVDPPWHAPDEEWAGELAGRTIPPGDPRNPLKARWMEFHDGAGIHGTDDIESLGDAASHGCVRMSIPDVKELYRKVRVGAPVFIA
jgi:lipoprotein-anchoring transpeptidase ErfK/SrfK